MNTLSEWMSNIDLLGTPLLDANGFGQLIIRFLINFVIVTSIIHFFYYPKSRRRDYYFTFSLINVSVFLLIFLLNSVKIKIGFASKEFFFSGLDFNFNAENKEMGKETRKEMSTGKR